VQDEFSPKKDSIKRLLIVSGLCSSGASIGHSVSVNFHLGKNGVIFEGCQKHNEPLTKAFNLDAYIGGLLLPIPQRVDFFYLRPGVAESFIEKINLEANSA
jgi:hypothetical protein